MVVVLAEKKSVGQQGGSLLRASIRRRGKYVGVQTPQQNSEIYTVFIYLLAK